jgi:hypothetical protein
MFIEDKVFVSFFSKASVRNILCSDKYLRSYARDMGTIACRSCKMSDLNESQTGSTAILKILHYKLNERSFSGSRGAPCIR